MTTAADQITLLPILTALRRLWRHLRPRRRLQLALLVVLAFVMSFAELLTIGAIVPFVSALVAPQQLLGTPFLAPLFRALSIDEPAQLLLPLTISFGLLGLLSAAIRLLQLYANMRFAFGLGSELSTSMYRRTLYQPYAVQVSRNSSEFISGIVFKTAALMNNVILGAVTLIGATVVAISVVVGLIWIDPMTTLLSFGGLGSVYVLVVFYTRQRIHESGVAIARESNEVIKVLQEGLGGVRDVLIGHNQEAYAEAYRRSDYRLRVAQAFSQFIGQAPRYAIEGFAICVIAAVAYVLSLRSGGVAEALPVLAALALGAQRLLPVMQQIFNGIINIRTHHASLSDAVRILDQPLPIEATLPPSERLPFENRIEFRNVSFAYETAQNSVLRDVTLSIAKGAKIGLIGKTGSGKSTLIDILMALLEPTTGTLAVDGTPINAQNRRAWQARVSHVPQSIFLIDGSVADNIALTAVGQPIDMGRVQASAAMASLAETIAAFPKGYDTRVGERGVMLSGGQRQRIGIARALYKQADIIVLDEATSALDTQTEEDVMQSVEQMDGRLTFVIVAHRLSTLRNCDIVAELDDGIVRRVGTYSEIVEAGQ